MKTDIFAAVERCTLIRQKTQTLADLKRHTDKKTAHALGPTKGNFHEMFELKFQHSTFSHFSNISLVNKNEAASEGNPVTSGES